MIHVFCRLCNVGWFCCISPCSLCCLFACCFYLCWSQGNIERWNAIIISLNERDVTKLQQQQHTKKRPNELNGLCGRLLDTDSHSKSLMLVSFTRIIWSLSHCRVAHQMKCTFEMKLLCSLCPFAEGGAPEFIHFSLSFHLIWYSWEHVFCVCALSTCIQLVLSLWMWFRLWQRAIFWIHIDVCNVVCRMMTFYL